MVPKTGKVVTMSKSKEKILAAVKESQPAFSALPVFTLPSQPFDAVQKFHEVLKNIGGDVIDVSSYEQIADFIRSHFECTKRIVATDEGLAVIAETNLSHNMPHELEDIELFILSAHLAVAENGAVWITDNQLSERILPFIAQHIAIIIQEEAIVPTMHEAYEKIGAADYDFATFIAGPSKTADIEQSLVLGAHGPKSMTVFIMTAL